MNGPSEKFLTQQLAIAAEISSGKERMAFKAKLIRGCLVPSPPTTAQRPSPPPVPDTCVKSPSAKAEVALPPHPRQAQRTTGVLMDAIQSLMASLCPQVPDVKSLISLWTKQRMGRHISIMKIGFPVSSEPMSSTSLDPMSARGADAEMVSLSKDGALIEHNLDKSTVKEAVRMDEITRVTLSEDSDDSDEAIFNTTSFTIYTREKKIGSFTPPTDLEVREREERSDDASVRNAAAANPSFPVAAAGLVPRRVNVRAAEPSSGCESGLGLPEAHVRELRDHGPRRAGQGP